MTLHADSVAQMLGRLAGRFAKYGVRAERRGGRVWELPGPAILEVTDVHKGLALNHARKLNPWVSLAEFPWLMAGRNDIAWLLPYLPKAGMFSDDGTSWRGGYGPRLRSWEAEIEGGTDYEFVVDQLRLVESTLRQDPGTRQAVAAIWDPAVDWVTSKDIPCTLNISFMARQQASRLDMLVTMRSNDIVWGYSGVNAPNWCALLQVMAAAVGMAPGTYTHVANNMHAYERHWPMVQALATEPTRARPLDRPYHWVRPENGDVDIQAYTERCRVALDLAMDLREDPPPADKPVKWYAEMADISMHGPYEPLAHWLQFMTLHAYRRDYDALEEAIQVRPWRDAALAYAVRNQPTHSPEEAT